MHRNTVRYYRRVGEMHAILGGKCSACGGSEQLQIHHKDPAEKSFNPTRGAGSSWDSVLAELKKCELLCVECHKDVHRNRKHGLSMYVHHKCRCETCRLARRESDLRHEANKKAKSAAGIKSAPRCPPPAPGSSV